MNRTDIYLSPVARRVLADFWRQKLDQAYERVQTATSRYRDLLQEGWGSPIRSQDGPLAMAAREQSEALAEFKRLLNVFTEITLHGRVPQEHRASGVDGKPSD